MQESPPPLDERARKLARIAVVAAGYLVAYLLAPDRAAARVLLWLGIVLLGWLVVDRLTKWARDRSGMMIAGTTILGLGLGGVGLYLALR
ncbi:MAG TPA: hypothetical protein VIG64_03055 [Actinomycetota bacterium]|jgi:hypothetical protein